jgi:Tfp pilus assembly protein PilF
MKAGDLKRAKQYYAKALKLDPRNEHAKEMLEKLKESGRK